MEFPGELQCKPQSHSQTGFTRGFAAPTSKCCNFAGNSDWLTVAQFTSSEHEAAIALPEVMAAAQLWRNLPQLDELMTGSTVQSGWAGDSPRQAG